MNIPTNCHAIMFHHFHDGKLFKKTQGSISKITFEKKIKKLIKLKYKIINPQDWMNKYLSQKLSKKELCITFDDGLLCQYKIALPILNKYNIKAFWFIFTGPLKDKYCELEIFRKFRIEKFSKIENFYNYFFKYLKINEKKIEILKLLNKKKFNFYLKEHKFYTNLDRKFRFFRDKVYGTEKYNKIMYDLILKKKVNIKTLKKNLWIKKKHLKNLSFNNHEIGLHSYSHDTSLGNKNFKKQFDEYSKNYNDLKKIIKKNIYSCAYPSNSFNIKTINVLKKLKIKISFRSDYCFNKKSKYEIKRIDHTLI